MADGKEVKTFEDLKKTLAGHKPGDNVAIKVMRDGKEQTITVTLGEAPASNDKAQPSVQQSGPFLGVVTQALTARLKDNLGVTVDKGLVVTQVLPDSPAAKAGLADTDVITHFGETAVSNPQELRDAVRKAGTDKEVSLTVVRGSKTMTLKARLQEAPAGAAGLPGWTPRMPEGFEQYMPEGFENGQFRHFFSGMEKVPALEKKLQELENRVKELEKK
jgi:S1-C subfamily serine protease